MAIEKLLVTAPSQTPRAIFGWFYPQKNMLTDVVLETGRAGKFVYELSTGIFMDEKLYGVTVLMIENYIVSTTSLNCVFRSYDMAGLYIKNMQEHAQQNPNISQQEMIDYLTELGYDLS